jgi:hypothetical protein
MKRIALGLAASIALSLTPLAQAATLVVDGAGHLTGATGVTIGGSTYDVSFVEGTCPDLCGGCTSSSDFTFQTLADATAASQALLDQVLINDAIPFDGAYYLTFGCSLNESDYCAVITPFGLSLDGRFNVLLVDGVAAFNKQGPGDFTASFGATAGTFDSGGSTQFTWARYTLAGGVPEPASWAMMLLGFGAIGMAFRRSKRRSAVVA